MHRDIKPANMLLASAWTPTVAAETEGLGQEVLVQWSGFLVNR